MADYLLFKLGQKTYGIEIERVRATLRASQVEPLPHSDPRIVGLLQLKDEVIPVLELYSSLNMKFTRLEADQFFIIIEDKKQSFGIICDGLRDVKTFDTGFEHSTQSFHMEKLYIHRYLDVDDEILFFLNPEEIKKMVKGEIGKKGSKHNAGRQIAAKSR